MKPEFHLPYISRRSFLQRFGSAALGTTCSPRTIGELRILNTADGPGTGRPRDYKALICVFLNGGNDSNNMIIPTIPSEWDNYAAIRSAVLAIPNTDGGPATALAMNSRNGQTGYPADDGHTYGFHPAMPEMQALFNAGVVAPVFNVGTLSFPLTKVAVQREKRAAPAPVVFPQRPADPVADLPAGPALHQRLGRPHRGPAHHAGGHTTQGGLISMAVTLAGSNIFEVGNGNVSPQYAITTGGAVQLSGFSGMPNGKNRAQSRAGLDPGVQQSLPESPDQGLCRASSSIPSIRRRSSTAALATNANAVMAQSLSPTSPIDSPPTAAPPSPPA